MKIGAVILLGLNTVVAVDAINSINDLQQQITGMRRMIELLEADNGQRFFETCFLLQADKVPDEENRTLYCESETEKVLNAWDELQNTDYFKGR